MLAILKAGAAYLPLDPELSGRCAGAMSSPAAAPAWRWWRGASERPCPRLCRVHGARVRADSDRGELLAAMRTRRPRREGHAATTCPTSIYTSGSTGHPKGAMLGTAAWSTSCARRRATSACRPPTRGADGLAVLRHLGLEFLGRCWSAAGCVVVTAPASLDPERLLAELIARRRPRLQAVPSMLRAMLTTPASASTGCRRCVVVAAAKRCQPELARAWLRVLPRGAAAQRLRPDRVHRRRLPRLRDGGPRAAEAQVADRPADREHARLRPRPRLPAGAGRGARASSTSAAPASRAATWAVRS